MDYQKVSEQIIEYVGGTENINEVTRCTTRLRFMLKNKDLAQIEELQKVDGVLGVVYSMGQLQIVLGKNLISIFNTITKSYDLEVGDLVGDVEADDKEKKFIVKKVMSDLLAYITGAITPQVPGLMVGGMLKIMLLLVSLLVPGAADTQTYALLSTLSNIPFYYMPIFVAYGASKKLKCNPLFPMIVICALLHPDFISAVATGDGIRIFGIPVLAVRYSSSLLPALLIAPVCAKLEKLFNKVIPGIFKVVLVGMLTCSVSYVLGLTILGPIGIYLGNYVVAFLVWLQQTIGPVALSILAGALPLMIVTGMHTLFGPFMIQSIADVGYDGFFRPALILHNMSEGGACFGVAVRTKKKELRSEAISCAVGCIFAGVTEPAIYGITLRLKRPIYAVCAGGACGGLVAGILGAKAFVMGYSSILALPIFEGTIVAISISIVVSIVTSFVLTLIIGFDDSEFKA